MDQNKQKTAVIAGAGLSGLAAAVYLDELGYKVTLIEKKQILGGRAYSFKDKKTGLTVDNGQHLMVGAYHETLALLERVGAKSKVHFEIPSQIPLLGLDGKLSSFTLKNLRPPLHLVSALLKYKGLSFKDKLGLIRLGLKLKKYQSGKEPIPTDMTVLEWLESLKQSPKSIKNFWEILTLATLNDDCNVTTADGLITVLLKSYFEKRLDGFLIFPKVGLSELFAEPVETYLKLRNQTIIRNTSLKQIRILEDKVQSFLFSDGTEVKADLFISALPYRPLLNVLPKPFVENNKALSPIKNIQGSPIISINLFFDRPVFEHKLFGSASTRTHWFFNKDLIFPENKDEKISHIMGVISGAYELLDKDKTEIIALALKDLEVVVPQIKEAKLIHSLVNKEREATLSCRKGINAIRPKQKILENFYCIGDWTQTGLPGTIESAILSSKMMTEEISSLNS